METSKKKRSCSDSLSTDAEKWLSTRTEERCAKARKSICDEQNKEEIKRGSVRDVTTPTAFHKLLGNFLATSRISSNFFRSEQFFELSSNSEISE